MIRKYSGVNEIVITPDKGVVRIRKDSDLIISDSDYYWFQKNTQTCILKIWQDKGETR